MGEQFDDLQARGEKVGERSKIIATAVAKGQNSAESTSCLCVDEIPDAEDRKLNTEDEGQSSWSISPGENSAVGRKQEKV